MKGAREYKSSQETASSIAGNPYLAFGDGKSVIGYPIEKYERERGRERDEKRVLLALSDDG